MKPANYPYATMEDDGYKLQLFEEDAPEVPSDDLRYATKPGDTVKLVFIYKEPVRNHGVYGAERMWVQVLRAEESCLVGRLDSTPQFTDLLKSDSEVSFHPKHILSFWSASPVA